MNTLQLAIGAASFGAGNGLLIVLFLRRLTRPCWCWVELTGGAGLDNLHFTPGCPRHANRDNTRPLHHPTPHRRP